MNFKNSLILLQLVLLFLICVQFEIKSDEFTKAIYQEYAYSDNHISLKLRTDKIELCQNDSLELSLTIFNKSNFDIFVFKEFSFIYASDRTNNKGITVVIEYGGMYEVTLENNIKMKIIKTDSSYNINKILYGKDLLENDFIEFFNIGISFGYIPNIDSIYKYKNIPIYPSEPRFLDNVWLVVHNHVVDAALRRQDFGCFTLKFNKF